MTTKEIADQLVALCRAGRNIEAVDTLLSAKAEAMEALLRLEELTGSNINQPKTPSPRKAAR